ncbi:Xaa-Pro dipeptidase [Pseudoalteromonas citrea]|uniref:Xaa-Pro dipeptidase n=1 Tax=Pseudoalteromonas citrea TaxID=43655 RepID=A0AAD4AII0_9GAMM|nr:Xaa-Pro dipeptidase [Pseudoalteromonas citrea]
MRSVKEQCEVSCIRKAAEIADMALVDTLKQIKVGITEKELANFLDYRMQQLGSDGVSFDTILLFGIRSALPHGKPSEMQLKEGDFILIDFGAVVNGYRSDMTRTYVYKKASQEQQQLFNTVLTAHTAALSEVCDGASCSTVNDAAQKVIDAGGYKEYGGKGIGHGLGLYLHEAPFITPTNNTVLNAGNVITIEPGVYIPDVGGVRIEDDILVNHNGYECLTHAPKHFILE